MTDRVRFHVDGYCRVIELNRPETLNTLNTDMVKAMTTAIRTWEDSENCNVILITAVPSTKGKPIFCAGGDVVSMVKAMGNTEAQLEFFAIEYALNHLIGTCKKPIVSFIDGVTSKKENGLSQ